MNKLLVVLPVINEKENLEKMLPELLAYIKDKGSVLCIDDNSTDGTDKMFERLVKENPNVYYIRNNKKIGLGDAYKIGADFAIRNGYEWMQQMDSDLSHRVQDLKNFDAVMDSSDLIIGSRYVKGGGILNWPLSRRILSRGGSIYARMILGCPVNDLTGGFNRTRTKVLKEINFNDIKSKGYAFQIELKYRAHKKGFRIKEVPIIFTDRTVGQTKMSQSIVLEAIWKVWWMKFFL
ncbi:MAG: polyprenol monophosphomannose synthase [Pseudomonadota bacterium]